MEKIKIKADVRDTGSKGANRRLRLDGKVPAILYGCGTTPMGLSLNGKELTTRLRASGTNVLFDLELEGQKAGPLVVMIKDYQTDSMTRKITHVDLLKIDLKAKVHVKIPVHIVGKALGLAKGGLVEQTRREIEVSCLPDSIPEFINVDITELDLGHSLHLNDLKFPVGVEAPQGVNYSVVSIVAPREEKVEEPVVAVEATAVAGAPAAGAAAPAAEGTAAKAGAKDTKDTKEVKGDKK